MTSTLTPGARLRRALNEERPLQLVGTINAFCALLARRAGFRAIYLSGAGVANATHGLPDLGLTNLGDVVSEVRKVTSVTDLPLVVDADTGWGEALGIARTVEEMIRSGAAALHIEDQVAHKRCGHRPNKRVVAKDEMVDRIKAAVDARTDDQFVIIARTDAIQQEGLAAAIDRASSYVEAGADCVFPDAVTAVDHYRRFASAMPDVPVVANVTEFGETPIVSVDELRDVGVAIALYPLSAFRAMSEAARRVYDAIRRDGHQRQVLDRMQTREELYDVLGYHEYERKLDELFGLDGRDDDMKDPVRGGATEVHGEGRGDARHEE